MDLIHNPEILFLKSQTQQLKYIIKDHVVKQISFKFKKLKKI